MWLPWLQQVYDTTPSRLDLHPMHDDVEPTHKSLSTERRPIAVEMRQRIVEQQYMPEEAGSLHRRRCRAIANDTGYFSRPPARLTMATNSMPDHVHTVQWRPLSDLWRAPSAAHPPTHSLTHPLTDVKCLHAR